MKVQITIRGRRYTVRSDEDDFDLVAVAKYVDDKMTEIGERTPSLDDYTVAMLAALNIAEEFERYRGRVTSELDEIDREVASTATLLGAALPGEEA